MGKKQRGDAPAKKWMPKPAASADPPPGSSGPPAVSAVPQPQAKAKANASAPKTNGAGREGRAKIEWSFIPPGCDAAEDEEEDDEGSAKVRNYEESLVRGFWCPPRLRGRNESLIEAVNDWHFAMLNDSHRNQFFWDSMTTKVAGKRVIDIGAGSGLLSLMAARQGATDVLAIEASKDMVDLARLNTKRNGQEGIVRICHKMSNNLTLPEAEKADVIVSETLGALMLGEGMLDYMADARRRLAKPGATIIPAGGSQFAVLVSSASLAAVSSVRPECCHGFDLSAIGSLQDTGNLFFTKQWGFRLNSLPDLVHMSDRIRLLDVDFKSTERAHIQASKTFRIRALSDGIVHAVVASWEVWSDDDRQNKITTHPEDTKDAAWGFARDMQWGQGLQLIEDYDLAQAQNADRNSAPAPFKVKAGEGLLLTVRFSQPCRQTFQFTLRRAEQEEAAFAP